MVQLRAADAFGELGGAIGFQFQYGAIEGNESFGSFDITPEFQFQYGAIEGNPQGKAAEYSKISIPVWCN